MPIRTDYCGEVSSADIGRTVTVCGWVDTRRVHSEHLAFVDVRDHTGVVQVVVDERSEVRSEYVVAITGTVRARPDGMVNAALATGEIEIADTTVDILNAAEPPPFPMNERTDVDESIRLRHRYVDLRRPKMQRNLR
ncbi:MAG: aspartate--tRNA ligase, partial [Acidimicrobiales bacterium]|nr:aspartate--tRNA ligase [Acidimicrobiales bacterium]